MPASFLDTNIFVYSLGTAVADQRKRERATEILLSDDDLVLSVQVLQEFYTQATRPNRPDRISHTTALVLMSAWRRWHVVDLTVQVLDRALELCAAHRLNYWNSAIIAAASVAGCSEVLTEDMQDGASIAGVRIRNPFI